MNTVLPGTAGWSLPRSLIAAALALGLTACGMRMPSMPSMPFTSSSTSDNFFRTRLCGVSIDNNTKHARLRLDLTVTKPLPRGAVVETEFQNPLDKAVLTAIRTMKGDERAVEMVSPPFTDLRVRRYETVTRVYADAAKKQVLGIHTFACESLVDERTLGPLIPDR